VFDSVCIDGRCKKDLILENSIPDFFHGVYECLIVCAWTVGVKKDLILENSIPDFFYQNLNLYNI